jgi:hypothetical protein
VDDRWPNSSTPDGLPYIRKDGQINPDSRCEEKSDKKAFYGVCGAILSLALAYWYTGIAKYKEKAHEYITVWFIDAETRMNPNVEYSQYICRHELSPVRRQVSAGEEEEPGREAQCAEETNDLGLCVLEGRVLLYVLDGLALINHHDTVLEAAHEDSRLISLNSEFRKWLQQYFDWLLESPTGIAGGNLKNNHGTWYDVQLSHMALFLGRRDVAESVLQRGLQRRIELQINVDGHQPLEQKRSKSTEYEIFNLMALSRLANIGKAVGVDYWSHVSSDGRSMVRAVECILENLLDVFGDGCSQQVLTSKKSPSVYSFQSFANQDNSSMYLVLFECLRAYSHWNAVTPPDRRHLHRLWLQLFSEEFELPSGTAADLILNEDQVSDIRTGWTNCSTSIFRLWSKL